jgi:hypothetical protein
LLAGVVTYAAADASRLSELVVAIGATGVALAVLGLLRPWAWLVAGAIAAAGAAYAVELSLGPRTIDAWAPLVAAALFVAAELGFWSIEPCTARPERAVVLRRLVFLAASAFVVALVGSVLLYATTGASGGIGLESLGVTAAVVALAIIALLARRSRESGSAPA